MKPISEIKDSAIQSEIDFQKDWIIASEKTADFTSEQFNPPDAQLLLSQLQYAEMLREISEAHEEGRPLSAEHKELLEIGFGIMPGIVFDQEDGDFRQFPDITDLYPAYNYLALRTLRETVAQLIQHELLSDDFDLEAFILQDHSELPALIQSLVEAADDIDEVGLDISLLRVAHLALEDVRLIRGEFDGSMEVLSLVATDPDEFKRQLEEIIKSNDTEPLYDIAKVHIDKKSEAVHFIVENAQTEWDGNIRREVVAHKDGSIEIRDTINSTHFSPDWGEAHELSLFRVYYPDGECWFETYELRLLEGVEDGAPSYLSIEDTGDGELEATQNHMHRELGEYVDLQPPYKDIRPHERRIYNTLMAELKLSLRAEHDITGFQRLALEVRSRDQTNGA